MSHPLLDKVLSGQSGTVGPVFYLLKQRKKKRKGRKRKERKNDIEGERR